LGYEEAPADQPADLCVVNTCTVTVEGDAESRKVIRQLGRQNPGAEIIVTTRTLCRKYTPRKPGRTAIAFSGPICYLPAHYCRHFCAEGV
jgi:hypothetical protein